MELPLEIFKLSNQRRLLSEPATGPSNVDANIRLVFRLLCEVLKSMPGDGSRLEKEFQERLE